MTMTDGVVLGGQATAEPWFDADEMRWFAPPSRDARAGRSSARLRAPIRQVEASLAELSRAAAAALAPRAMIDAGGALALPMPGHYAGTADRSYRGARRRGWSPGRRKRFATRFVPTATLVVSAAVTLPSLLLRDDRPARVSAVPLTTPGLTLSNGTLVQPLATGEPRSPLPIEPATATAGGLQNVESTALSAAVALDEEAAATSQASLAAVTADPTPAVEAPVYEKIEWRDSAAQGAPYAGHLHDGVRLPIEGRDWITWDPANDRVPNRAWRLYGSDRTVRTLVRVARAHRAANPGAPPLLVGDLSGEGGGPLDQHVSHQNGLDIDIYYPRKDGKATEPTSTDQIDLALTQDLVDRFVAAGAQFVFVGYSTPLSGPAGIVQPYPNHENHLHVRLRP